MMKHTSTTFVLAGLSLSMLMPSLDTSIAHAALPTLAHAFGASFRQAQWIVVAYLLALTATLVGAGRLGDRFGRRRLLLAGIALFTLASLLCGIAPTLWLLIGARAAQGLGAAAMLSLTIALVGDAVPKARTGSAMGLLGSMSAIGTTLGPSLGGLLTAGLGWRAIFLVNLPLGLLNLWLVWRHLPADRRAARTEPLRFDLATLLRDPALSASLLMSALVSTVMMATLVVGPFYLARSLGLDATRVGFALSVGPLAAALAGVPAGRLVDRFGASRTTLLGLTGIGAGSLALASTPAAGLGLVGYLVPILVITTGYALFQTANNSAAMTDVAAARRGVVSGMLSLSRNLGLITGASAMGAVFAAAAASADITTASAAAVAGGMRATFAVAALLIGLAIGAALAARMLTQRAARARIGPAWSAD